MSPTYVAQENGNVAGVSYAHQQAPWDSPLSFGVQAFIEYNGYIINDRRQADRIRVLQITGLDDGDVSDSREVIPGDDGENAYDSWYRGRTITLTGEISAGSLGVLKRLERDVKAAFGPLAESPLTFRWFDIHDSFDDPNTLQNYTAAQGSTTGLTVSGGTLSWQTIKQFLLTRTGEQRLWGDNATTIRVIVGGLDNSKISVVPSFYDANNYVEVALATSVLSTSIVINVVIGGTTRQLAFTNVNVSQSQPVWLCGRRDGDLITAELWTTPPKDSTLPAATASAYLSGSDADLLGDQALTLVGFGANTQGSTWGLDDFHVASICPCDVALDARKLSSLSMTDTQQSMSQYKRNFQITMRASKPYARCATQSRSAGLQPSNAIGATQLGFSSPLTSPLSARFFTGAVNPENNLLFVTNRGTAPDRPLVYLAGGISDFLLVNLTNDMQLQWSGAIADGDYLFFDCSRRTLVDSNGNDQKDRLTYSDPRWMLLEPGVNDFYLVGSNYTAKTNLVVFSYGRYK